MTQRSLQILGDQTEASLRKAVVGTAFTVLVMMLATWVAICCTCPCSQIQKDNLEFISRNQDFKAMKTIFRAVHTVWQCLTWIFALTFGMFPGIVASSALLQPFCSDVPKAVVAMDSFRAWKAPVASGALGSLWEKPGAHSIK